MMRVALLLAALALPAVTLPACAAEQPGPPAPGVVWRLAALDGAPFAARATLRFDGAGRIDGQAPCNRYSAAQPLALPGFAAGPVAATRMACPDLAAEGAYFAALEAMTRAEIRDEALVLSNAAGRSMTFRRAD